MKKILGIIAVFLLALTLVACGGSEAIKEVKETLPGLFADPDNVTAGFTVPTEFMYDVEGTWSSSNEDYLHVGIPKNGMVSIGVSRPNFADGDKVVKLTVELKDGNAKEKWSIDLKIIKLTEDTINAEGLKDAVTPENAGKTIIVKNVALYYPQGGNGYYLSSADGGIAFVYGQTNMPEAGKLYNLTAQVDNYYNSLQLSKVNLQEVAGEANHVVEHKEMTLAEIFALPQPSEANIYGHDPIKVKNVKVVVQGTGNYNTFLVDKDQDPSVPATGANSIMLYYHSQIADLRALAGITINEIDLVLEGYRTDQHKWYFSYLKPIDELDTVELTDADKVGIAKNSLQIVTEFKVAGKLELPAAGLQGTDITWAFKDPENVENARINLTTGDVTVPENTQVAVTLTATITKGEAEDKKDFVILLGDYPLITVADALGLEKNQKGKIKGIITDQFANGTYGLQDETGSIAIFTYDKVTVGKVYTLVGVKDVYNGLPQFKNIDVEATEDGLMPAPFAIDAILGNNTELEKHIGKRVSIEGAEVTVVGEVQTNGNISVKIKKGEAELEIRYDSRVAGANATQLELTVGDIVNYVGNLGWYKGPQLGFGPNTFVGEGWPEVDEGIELPYVMDFGTVQLTGYGAGDLTFVNTSGKAFTIKKDRAQINTSTYAPHTDQGALLVLAPISTTKESFAEFDLGLFEGMKTIKFGIAVWNDKNFDKIKGLEGSVIALEVWNGTEWVAVKNAEDNANIFTTLTNGSYAESTFTVSGPGKYRIVYNTPNNPTTGNTDHAITVNKITIS